MKINETVKINRVVDYLQVIKSEENRLRSKNVPAREFYYALEFSFFKEIFSLLKPKTFAL